jgi:hypothetical protein
MEALLALIGTLFFIFLCIGLGRFLFIKVVAEPLARFALSLVIITTTWSLLGLLGIFNPLMIWLSLVSLYICLIPWIKEETLSLIKGKKEKRKFSKLSLLIYFIICLYFALMIFKSFTPPLSRDAINYHLFLPKLWLKEAKICTIKNNIYSFFPSYWEVLYALILSTSNDIACKLIHLFYTFLTYLLLGKLLYLLKPDIEKEYVLLSQLIFLSTPLITKISSWAYVDIPFTFYCLLSLYLLLKFFKEGKRFLLFSSALACGFAIGIKYLGLIWLGLLSLTFLEQMDTRKKGGNYIFFLTIAILFACPFYLRNLIETNNPFYPFLYSFFDGKNMSPHKAHLLNLYFMESFGMGKSFLDLLLLPFRICLFAKFDDPKRFDGQIGIIYLILLLILPFTLKRIKFPYRSIHYLIILYLLIWFATSQQLRFLIPVLCLSLLTYGFILSSFRNKFLNLIIIGLSSIYLIYPIKELKDLRPFKFIIGKESRDQFLKRHLKAYPIIQYINLNLPHNSKLMLLDVGPIAYYVEREIFQESVFEEYTLRRKLNKSLNVLLSYLEVNKIDYILINVPFIERHFFPYLSLREKEDFKTFIQKHLRLVARYKGFYLYKFNKRSDI